MPNFLKVARTVDVVEGTGQLVVVEGKRIALFRVGDAFHAIDDTCTHRGGSLSEGALDGTKVTCPRHGADFDVTTGKALGGPASVPVARYDVRVVGDDVEVGI